MEYTLMHKNIPVAEMLLDESGYIAKVTTAHDIRHLPPGVRCTRPALTV